MFTKVHHVTYAVENVQSMADYLETNFGLKLAQGLQRGSSAHSSATPQ